MNTRTHGHFSNHVPFFCCAQQDFAAYKTCRESRQQSSSSTRTRSQPHNPHCSCLPYLWPSCFMSDHPQDQQPCGDAPEMPVLSPPRLAKPKGSSNRMCVLRQRGPSAAANNTQLNKSFTAALFGAEWESEVYRLNLWVLPLPCKWHSCWNSFVFRKREGEKRVFSVSNSQSSAFSSPSPPFFFLMWKVLCEWAS